MGIPGGITGQHKGIMEVSQGILVAMITEASRGISGASPEIGGHAQKGEHVQHSIRGG